VALSPTPLAALRYWNVARQRYTRRLARNGKPCASLATQPPSQPRTPARKAGVLDARKWLRERDGLSAGGRWIRTIGTHEREAYFFPGRNSLAGTASRRGRTVGSNGQRSVRTATSAMAPSGNRPFCGSAFWRMRRPSGRVSRWPQPALFAQYSRARVEELGRERAQALAEARGRSVIHPRPCHRAASTRPNLKAGISARA
jgi:hypothetical protein